MKKIILISILALLLVAGGVAGTLFFTGAFSGKAAVDAPAAEEAAAAPKGPQGPPIYVSLDPAFTVTFGDTANAQFLQVQVEVLTRDPEVQKTIETNMPALRNGLLMLFSSQTADKLQSREGKEKLRDAALKEIQGIVHGYIGKPGIEQVFFTSFLMQ